MRRIDIIEFKTELMQHQRAAVEKVKKLKVGALNMEQGTGKTRTTLEIIEYRRARGKIDKVLWLCPCSVKVNLRKDIEKHTGSAQEDLIKIMGIESLSSSIRINQEAEEYMKSGRVMLVVDESLLIKNFRAKRTENIIRLGTMATYRMILNGTPISRNESDLFAQWYFLDWRILGYKSFYSFAANHLEYDDYGRIRNVLDIDNLAAKIAPYTYQVKKSECLDLPEKYYRTVYCDFTKEQMEAYNEVCFTFESLIDEEDPSTIYRFFTALQDVISGQNVKLVKNHITTTPLFKDPEDNPRIQFLLHIVNDYEKTIIFCKYTHEIETLEKVLKKHYGKDSVVKFYGEMSLKERAASAEQFEKNEKTLFFIANKSCGAYGLNLQFCSKMIFYSNDWDLGTRMQAEDRIHRIGQDKRVEIIDIVADGTLDEQIQRNLANKRYILESLSDEIDKRKNNIMLDILKDFKEARKHEKSLHK